MMEGQRKVEPQEKPLMDLMVMDTEEDLKEKKQAWEDIFMKCPDFSDFVIKLFKDGGESAMFGALDMLKETYNTLGENEEDTSEKE